MFAQNSAKVHEVWSEAMSVEELNFQIDEFAHYKVVKFNSTLEISLSLILRQRADPSLVSDVVNCIPQGCIFRETCTRCVCCRKTMCP